MIRSGFGDNQKNRFSIKDYVFNATKKKTMETE